MFQLFSFESNKKVCQNKDFLKILEFNLCQKSDKIPSIIYADLEPLIKKVDGRKNILEKLSTIIIGDTFNV